MKITFLIISLRSGGAERVMTNLANEMSTKNEVSIITLQNNSDQYELNKAVKRIRIDKTIYNEKKRIKNKLRKISIFRLISLVKSIKGQGPDVVITFLPLPSIYIMIAKIFSKTIKETPVVLSERADPNVEYKNKVIAFLIKKLYKRADGFVFQTKDAEAYYKGFINCRTTIIENPIDDTFLNHATSNVRKKTIVSCGRLTEQKNFKLLINAFAKFSSEIKDYELCIYGDGEQRCELSQLINTLGMENKIRLGGRVKNIADEINDAGMFVLASYCEGMPNALMEAMALGIPCISTDCPVGGPRALIKNGKNGILIDVNNMDQLVEAMQKIATDDKYASKLAKNGAEKMKEYSLKKIADRWDGFINEVVDR